VCRPGDRFRSNGQPYRSCIIIEERLGTTVRVDPAESEAIEAAQNGLAVPRGEWFGGLSESMTAAAPTQRMVALDLFVTLHGEKEWLGSFQSIDSAS
jgi:hypothetical protein